MNNVKLNAGTLNVWDCPNSEGEPVCVSTNDDDPQGHSVNLYVRGGTIVGVEVYRKVSGVLAATAGLVPVHNDDD